LTQRYVYSFEEAADVVGPDAAVLGGKGAGLVAMTARGLPVPPGFIITAPAGRRYLAEGRLGARLREQVRGALADLAKRTGRTFGGGPRPLLVAVRSGAQISMPGMMDTVLDVGAAGPPADPCERLWTAVETVFCSWHSERAAFYRRAQRLDDDAGTAVTVQMMVQGNLLGERVSGSGVLFTRDPVTGEPAAVGEFLPGGRGIDLVDGLRTPETLAALREPAPDVHARLLGYAAVLERWLTDMCDIEFTVEDGTLWLLQVRAGKRTAEAAARIAVDLADEGVITRVEAVRRAGSSFREQRPVRAAGAGGVLGRGIGASPGIGTGQAVFDADSAAHRAEHGEHVVLIREFTQPSDVHGMAAAAGMLTRTGGRMSHAAVIAREFGVPCVCGVRTLVIDMATRTARLGDRHIIEGDEITVDGTAGTVLAGVTATTSSARTPFQERIAAWAGAVAPPDRRRDDR
jgi:pyruvate, orthophosphate dikinase